MTTNARVIADSLSNDGDRITTIEATMHRFVLAELNTHRVFSRNSASSRAIPLTKQLAHIENDPAFPVVWPSERPGMQGGEPLSHDDEMYASYMWGDTAHLITQRAEELGRLGLHKSVVNRLLEPWMWHTVIITSTAWQNFFTQRCSPLAQPEIRVAAEKMRAAYDASKPTIITDGGWHLPYIDNEDYNAALYGGYPDTLPAMVKVSVARCARVSYLTHDGKRDIHSDLSLYDKLVSATPMHGSPLEHVATPDASNKHRVNIARNEQAPVWVTLPTYGNVLGWRQHRFDVEADLAYEAYS